MFILEMFVCFEMTIAKYVLEIVKFYAFMVNLTIKVNLWPFKMIFFEHPHYLLKLNLKVGTLFPKIRPNFCT